MPSDMVALKPEIMYMKESHGDWFGVEHGSGLVQDLEKQFNVIDIPTLVVLKADGTVISKDGIKAVCTQGPRPLVGKWMQQSEAECVDYRFWRNGILRPKS